MAKGNSDTTDAFKDFSPEEINAVASFLRNMERLRNPDAIKALRNLSAGFLPLTGISAVRTYFDAVAELDISAKSKRDIVYEALKTIRAAELLSAMNGLAERNPENGAVEDKTAGETGQVSMAEPVEVLDKEAFVSYAPEKKETVEKEKQKKLKKDVEKQAGIYRITMGKLCVSLIMKSEAYAVIHNNHIITRDYLLEHFGDLLVVEVESRTVWVHLVESYLEEKERVIKNPKDEALFQDIIHIIIQDGVLMR